MLGLFSRKIIKEIPKYFGYKEEDMVILVCILVFLFAEAVQCVISDAEARRRNEYKIEERRHKELVEATRKRSSTGTRKVTRRRVAKQGNVILGEEITEEYDE